MRKLIFIFVALICNQLISTAQNLVVNPSFEIYAPCPMGPSELTNAANWTDPFVNIIGDTCSTSDLYNACNTLGSFGVDVPVNIMGNEAARTGDGYGAIIIYEGISLAPGDCSSLGGSGWREYLAGELSSPMSAGQQYCVSFWVSLADEVKWGSNNFGVHLSNSPIAINCASVGSNSDLSSYGVTPQLVYTGGPILNTNGWTKIEWTYTAVGGEQYITLGNFYGNSSTTYVCSNANAFNPYAYYFVDDVSVVVGVCCDTTVDPVSPLCTSDSPITFNPFTLGGTWSSSPVTAGLNTSTGVFNPSVAGVGTYTITYTLSCGGTNSFDLVVATCSAMSVCVETNGDLTVTGGTGPYDWDEWTPASSTPITNSAECAACGGTWIAFPGGCFNPFPVPFDDCNSPAGWSNFASGVTVTPPVGADSIQVTDAFGNNLEIYNIGSLPSCSTTCDATITAAGPFCVNAAAVNLTAAQTGGTWSGTGITNTTNGTFNPATAGAGSHTITYTLGCGDVDTETIVVNALANAGFSYSSASYCLTDANPTPTITGLAGGTFTINNSGVINSSTGVLNITGSGVGSYTVTYTTIGTCPNSATFNITITSSTNATITQAGPFCSNAAAVNLSAVSPGGNWTGTGITNASLGTFNPTTAGAGSHVITYTITGSCGSVDTMTIVVNASTDASFTYLSGSYCLSDPNPSPTITGTLGGTFTINNSGVINSSTGVLNLAGSGLGSYVVTYTTTGVCPDTNTFNITITNTTNATITQAGPFCLNAAASNLTAVSSGGTWTGTGITNATLGTFNPTTAGVGNHVITYSITGSCGSVDTMTIVVNAIDNAAFTYSSNTFCLTDPNPSPTITGLTGGIFTINNGGVINSGTGAINLTSSGTGTFTVTYTTNGSCPNSQTFNLNINNCSIPLPIANFSTTPTNICIGDCINFTDMSTSSAVGGITTWAWAFTGAVTTSSSLQSPSNICYNTAGTYQVVLTVTDANGSDTETKTGYITVTNCSPPTSIFSFSDDTICAGTCITFTNNSIGATSWQWTFEKGNPLSSTAQNPTSVCYGDSGTHEIKLVVTNAYGSDSLTQYIIVLLPQQVFVGNDTIIQLNQSINLNATGVVNGTYTWTPPTDLTCTTCPNPIASPEETITYTIIASDTNGCRTTDNITIIVDFKNVIFVPNIFSPNGDGANDILFVRGKGVANLKFFVYDRWGEKVFETTSLDVGWDGTFRGKDMNKAVFVYYLEATFIDGKEVTQKGDITLVK